MKSFKKSAFSLHTASIAIVLAGLSAPTSVFAQEAPGADSAENCIDENADGVCDSEEKTQIVVTGSRISRPNLQSAIPITSITGDQFFDSGDSNVGDSLNDLPQLRSTFSQQNPGLGVGIAGLNLLDLRGLGTVRTLVLVNGRRHVGSDILNNAISTDANTVPNDLIERVDIVTGANSAVYGTDAIAGVVNFVLRREYDGIQIRGKTGISEAGFGGNQYVSAMFGKNFGDGAGNITLHGEYARQERVFASDIPSFRRQDGFGVIDVDPSGLANGSDSFPDRTFVRDIRSASIHRFGLVPITQGTAALCGTGLGSTNGSGSAIGTNAAGALTPTLNGVPYNCTYIFTPEGRLVQQTGARYSTGIIGNIAGGNGQTGREEKLLSVLPRMERYNFNLLAHYAISDAFEPFIEAKWNRVHAIGSNAGPSFIQGTFGQFDLRECVRLDNPFLNPADRTTITNLILASGCNTSLTTACITPAGAPASRTTFGGQGVGGPLNAADIAAINAGTYRFVTARSLADSGIRDEEFTRDTFRVVAGFRGTFNTDWKYELSANYGEFKEDTTTFGYLDRQRFMLSLDAGRNPATGAIECRAKFDPAAQTAFAGGAARLNADIAACVPYNPFGGSDNSAAAAYFTFNAKHKAKMTQFDVMGFVSGDTSGFFNLPGGPVEFSVGAEYRKETYFYDNDDFVESGATNAVVIGGFDPPAFEVKEAFGELQIPILSETPFFHDLRLTGAGRVSDNSGSAGTVWTYNFGGEWAPIPDLRFRANYGKATRVPNASETGFPAVPNFAPNFLDPCASSNIANNPNRQANCLADLGAALLGSLPNVAYSLPIISGSNLNLKPETSHSLTIGAVFQPRAIPGFSLSVDYYDIKVDGVIVSLTAQNIANGCYDQPTLNNPLCSVFTRWRGPGVSPLGFQPGQILENSLVSAPVNFAKRIRRGIDVNAGYKTKFSEDVSFDTQLVYVHSLKSSNYQNPSLPNFEDRLLGEIGDPEDEFRWDVDLKVKDFTIGYRMHYIGPMVVNLYEDFFEVPGACSNGTCPPNNADWADIQKFPAVFYHDVRFSFDFSPSGGPAKNFQFYVGIDNLLNTQPPLGSTATGSGSAIYEFRGRNYYTGVRVRF